MDKPPCTSNDFDVIELGSSDDERLEGYRQSNGGPLGFASFLKEECATSQTKTLLNLVDASYELVDPSPNIHELFVTFDHQFFWGTLNSNACIVEWSKTMTSCAGLCRFSVGNRLCSIRLSEPLLKLRPRRDLVETLLHEMIHAYQFVTNGIQDRDGHGPDFQSHMHRINKLAGTSITVYHSFHAEVAHYKQHWWRCTGPCKDRPPFFGWVKRAMNRAPSANDLWWATHQASCSGKFVKVKEPEKKEKATKINVKKSPTNRKRSSETETTQPKIDIFFPGKGYVLGNEAVTTSAFMEEERRGPSNSQSTSTVDGETEKPVAKRKRRTKEEIEQEKLNKEVNKVCRQIQSAKNTKCEQYLFCHFSSKILCLNDNLAVELEKRFEERGITEQIVYDKSHNNLMQVFWLKKRLEAFLEDGKLHKNERMELQNVFCCVLSGETYSVLVKSRGNSMMDYLDEQMATVRQKISGDPQLTVVVFGTHHVRENTVSSLIFEAFEKHRIQFRFVSDAFDFSFLIAQYHRALAKMEKKAEKQILVEQSDLSNGTHFVAEKGIADGPSMVSDWWEKMLEHLHRMSEEQKRAIMEAHPNPYKLMEWLLEPDNTAGQAMFALSEIQMESGRRLGPVLAQKIYKMLTSRTGTESTE
uniref:SprT-like domain-containing protein n=1 Tax=Globodera rostochiensis TaxID=31243 RepID=A0A914HNZ3_GLORO